MVIYANILSTGLMSKNLAFYAMLGRILSYSRPIQSMEEHCKSSSLASADYFQLHALIQI